MTLQAECQNIEYPVSFAPSYTCILCNYNLRFLSLSWAVNVENTGFTALKTVVIFNDEIWEGTGGTVVSFVREIPFGSLKQT